MFSNEQVRLELFYNPKNMGSPDGRQVERAQQTHRAVAKTQRIKEKTNEKPVQRSFAEHSASRTLLLKRHSIDRKGSVFEDLLHHLPPPSSWICTLLKKSCIASAMHGMLCKINQQTPSTSQSKSNSLAASGAHLSDFKCQGCASSTASWEPSNKVHPSLGVLCQRRIQIVLILEERIVESTL